MTFLTLQATYCYFNQLCTCKVQAAGGGSGSGSFNGSSTLASGPGSPSLLQVLDFPLKYVITSDPDWLRDKEKDPDAREDDPTMNLPLLPQGLDCPLLLWASVLCTCPSGRQLLLFHTAFRHWMSHIALVQKMQFCGLIWKLYLIHSCFSTMQIHV